MCLREQAPFHPTFFSLSPVRWGGFRRLPLLCIAVMENIEERILQYPDLSPEEQRAVEAQIRDHPGHAALLADIKALDRLLASARALDGAPDEPGTLDDEALAHFLASPRRGERPAALEDALGRIEAALGEAEAGSPLHERATALAQRLRALDEQTQDTAAHFAVLSEGSSTEAEAVAEPAGSWGAEDPDAKASGAEGRPRGASDRPSRARKARSSRPLRRWGRYAAAAVLAVGVLYGALFAASRLSQSQMERLALVESDRLSVEGYGLRGMRTRGGRSPADSARLDRRYLRSLRELRAARTSTLGLFPRYDAAALRRAARELEAIAQAAEPRSFIQLEALFFLGKARLAQGDRSGATQAFRKVVAGGGRLAPEAQDILTQLHEDAAYDGPPGRE